MNPVHHVGVDLIRLLALAALSRYGTVHALKAVRRPILDLGVRKNHHGCKVSLLWLSQFLGGLVL